MQRNNIEIIDVFCKISLSPLPLGLSGVNMATMTIVRTINQTERFF
ncbi:MAG: hypothetical protein OEW37_01965 [Rhodospirillaceae bacterium]|nr:hypothetical protein [Rhodospirillaceae bacterium]